MKSAVQMLRLGSAASAFAPSTLVTSTASSIPSAASSTAAPDATTPLDGCAAIVSLHESTFEANHSATLREVAPFAPSRAFECLTSVPIDQEAATGLLGYYKPYLEFQSTLAWLKDPPESYQQPAVDLVGGLDHIASLVSEGAFENQYAFELAIQQLLQGAHEGHLALQTPLYSLFVFSSPFEFVSLSSDGAQMPQVYVYHDFVLQGTSGADLPWSPSPVSAIDGQKAEDFLTGYAEKHATGTIEPHADYNSVMFSAARLLGTGGVISSPLGRGLDYLGSDTMSLTFANGTEISGSWQAAAQRNLSGLATGEDVYRAIVAPRQPSPPQAMGPSEVTDTLPELGAPYPKPVMVQRGLGFGGSLSGYFLKETSVAVLSITSFLMLGDLAATAQDAVSRFLRQSREAGMKRLVIDLQGNGGGAVLLGIDLFKQLFLTDEPFVGSRLRAHSSLNTIGSTLGSVVNADSLLGASPFNIGNSVDLDGRDFSGWDDFYGPHPSHGDFYTATERYNLTAVAMSEARSGNGIVVSGYGSSEGSVAPQYFAPEDILLLTDGFCASTCSVFAEQMRSHQGVKSVVVGGLPTTGAMQAVAGTRGALRSGADMISATIDLARLYNTSIDSSTLPSTAAPPINVPLSGIAVNFRDQVREEAPEVPLQFLYEPADCRIFYTAEMLTDYSVLWQTAADALWTNSSLCVEGSFGQEDSHNGTGTDGQPDSPESTSSPESGASSLASSSLIMVVATIASSALF